MLKKSIFLTAYLEYLLEQKINHSKKYPNFEQITPQLPDERGSHISIKFSTNINEIYEELEKYGIVVCIFFCLN